MVATHGTLDLRYFAGMSTSLRSAQMRSPKTPLDAQFFVDFGGLNSRGLITMNTTDRAIGTSDHQPIQSRLQTETTSIGTTANRVQTLQALACCIQWSPSSPNALATRFSLVV